MKKEKKYWDKIILNGFYGVNHINKNLYLYDSLSGDKITKTGQEIMNTIQKIEKRNRVIKKLLSENLDK